MMSRSVYGMHRSVDQDSSEKVILQGHSHGIFQDTEMLGPWAKVHIRTFAFNLSGNFRNTSII